MWVLLGMLGIFFGCADSEEKREPQPYIPASPSIPSPDSTDVTPSVDSVETVIPLLTRFVFRCDENPYQLQEDVVCDIIDDSVVVCRIPNIVENKLLVPDIQFEGESLLIDGVQYHEGKYDFQR